MIRRFNYTGRKRIPTNCLRLRIDSQDPPQFEADLDLRELAFPPSAQVFLDVSQVALTTSRRFPLGTVGRLVLPTDRSLVGFEPASLQFEIKVVEPEGEHAGRLLGISSVISPRRPGDPQDAAILPLLPVHVADIGSQVWRLAFDRARPHLMLNQRIPGIVDIARGNSAFFGVVYPAVVRAVLTRILIVEDTTEPVEDDYEGWISLWLLWAIGRHPDREPARGEASERLDWIEDVVASFCDERAVLDGFLEAINPMGGES